MILRLRSLWTALGWALLLALPTLWFAGVPPAVSAQTAPPEREVLESQRLEIYQPNGRFSQSEVQWMLWYLLGVCVLGFVMFAVLRILFRDHHALTLGDKSRGSTTHSAKASDASAESTQPPSEHRYKL